MSRALPSRSPLGVLPHYVHAGGTAHAPTLRGVLREPGVPARWDAKGVRQYLQRRPDGMRTCFADIHFVPPMGTASLGTAGDVRGALEHAVDELAADTRRAAIALSGGLDSALVVAMLRTRRRDDIPVYTLASHLPGYCELETTRETARQLGVKNLRVIETSGEAMAAAFGDAITAAECPLFNLHPVSRWVLAQRLRAEGCEVLITGDGADQVFAGSDPRNYLPIIGALTRAAGLELRSPFLQAEVIASAPPATADKAALRAVAADFLAAPTAQQPKRPTYAPALDVSAHWNAAAIASLANELSETPAQPGAGPDSVLWTALGILAGFLPS